MTRERIEDMREVVLPFVKKRLLEINYENLGESDSEEFAKEFNEILNLAIKALEQEPTTQERQAESDKFDAAFQDGYDNGYAQARFDYEQEPTPKNNLGVDTNKLLADCEKMSFDIEIFNKPLKVVALDAVKNIAKDLIRKTPNKSEILTDSTTKNEKVDCEHTDCNNCVNHKYCDYEPTTKNDLGVDCIDRNSIKYYSGQGGYMYASKGEIDKLPSVTPQDSFKPMVEIDLYSVIKQKYIEREVLDKIRAEIEQIEINGHIRDVECFRAGIYVALNIIDKYKAEVEPQESEEQE